MVLQVMPAVVVAMVVVVVAVVNVSVVAVVKANSRRALLIVRHYVFVGFVCCCLT